MPGLNAIKDCEKAEFLKAERLASNLSSHDFNTFGSASKKQIMPDYLTPVMLQVAVVLKMSETCSLLITNRCLILYLTFLFTSIDKYCGSIQINDNTVVKVKELQEIISTMIRTCCRAFRHCSSNVLSALTARCLTACDRESTLEVSFK